MSSEFTMYIQFADAGLGAKSQDLYYRETEDAC